MPYVLISTQIRLAIGPTIVGDESSNENLMHALGAELKHTAGNNFKEWVVDKPPRVVLNHLERLGYKLVGTTGIDTDEPFSSILQSLSDQNYDECLVKCLNIYNIFESLKDFSYTIESIKDNTISLEELTEDTNRKIWLYSCAVSVLQLFIQINWTGPCVDATNVSDEVASESLHLLSEDNQSIYHLVKQPHLLFAAKIIFSSLLNDPFFQTVAWWLFRCHCVHSQLMLDRTETLFKSTIESIDHVASLPFLQEENHKSLLFQFHLEAGLSLLHYYQYKEADKQFESARKLSGIEFGFTGVLGVRTKFQKKAVSQLQVYAKRKSEEVISSMVSDVSFKHLPQNLSLNDDTLLDKVKLIDEKTISNPVLTAEEYCMILSACTAMQKTNPAHRLREEKLQAVIEFLLSEPSCWCIHLEALRLRCVNEKDRSRTVERSMTQLDQLVRLAKEGGNDVGSRLDLFYAVRPPPLWILQKDLAKLYMSLGATSSALDIYEKLEMWEDAILCLIRTDRPSDAMHLIQKRLEVEENATLWCLLGDILQEPKHYVKAWEISKHKSTRAMTSLGCYYISTKDYEKAVECFEKSLSILSLQVNTWFTMGCALLQLERYQKAADAFRRCVGLDWDNFEAWTNLSTSYVRCGKKEHAFKALSEAIKCNFDQWQLWENYVAISTDVGRFNEAISAYNRLLELKRKYVDVPVLEVLVRCVTDDIPDVDGNPGSALKAKVLTLFGHVTSQTTNDSRLWELYARLCGDGVGEEASEKEKSIVFLHKALRTGSQKAGWEKDESLINKLTGICRKLSLACSHSPQHIPIQLVSSIRLSVNGFLSKLKQREKSLLEASAQDELRNVINEVGQYYESIDRVLSELKS